MIVHIYPSPRPRGATRREWRWRLLSKGRIVAHGGEGYKNKAAIYRFLRRIFNGDQPRAYVKFFEYPEGDPGVRRVKRAAKKGAAK